MILNGINVEDATKINQGWRVVLFSDDGTCWTIASHMDDELEATEKAKCFKTFSGLDLPIWVHGKAILGHGPDAEED